MLSIIIPFVSETDLLKEALSSAQQQEGIEKEIILVCNASTPLNAADLDILLTSGTRLIHEPQAGSNHARNFGLNQAKGEWIQFLDVDDLLLPGKIEQQLRVSSQADVIVAPHLFTHLNGKKDKSKWLADDVWVGLLDSGLGSTSSMLWRREALNEVGGWNTNYQSHQEYELLFRLLQAGKKIIPLDRPDTIVRARKSGSITKMTKATRGIEGVVLRELMWMYLVQNGMETPERKNAFRHYIFRQLRGWYRINAAETMKKYRQHFHKRNFTPAHMGIPGYGLLYKTFGFRSTEFVLKTYSRLRDSFFPFLPVHK